MYKTETLYTLLRNLLELRTNEKINSIDYLCVLRWIKNQALKSYIKDKITIEQYCDVIDMADRLTHGEHCNCGNYQ